MRFLVFISITSIIVSCGLTCLYLSWARRRSILDRPNERSSHAIPTPRGGGVAIIVSFYLMLIILFYEGLIESKLFFALLPGLGIAAIGFIDDLKSLSPLLRLLSQILFATGALIILGGLNLFEGGNSSVLWFALTVFGMVWFINLYNFMDGADGYASMEAIFVALAFYIFTKTEVTILLACAIVGFLFWNWPKAKVFMGDVGSTTLGFILIVIGIYFHNQTTIEIYYFLILTSLFWFDATLTILRRAIKREKLTTAHNKHLYQILIRSGYSHIHTLFLGLTINLALLIICILLNRDVIPIPGAFTAVVVLFLIYDRFVHYVYRGRQYDI